MNTLLHFDLKSFHHLDQTSHFISLIFNTKNPSLKKKTFHPNVRDMGRHLPSLVGHQSPPPFHADRRSLPSLAGSRRLLSLFGHPA
jgi:hypothetical protein